MLVSFKIDSKEKSVSDYDCNCGQSHLTAKEKGVVLGQETMVDVAIQQCPFCLGRLNGRVSSRLGNFPDFVQDEAQTNSDNIAGNLKDNATYQKGVTEGENDGYLSVKHSILKEYSLEETSPTEGSFLVQQNEFGETYHIATAMLCTKSTTANLEAASSDQRIFFAGIFDIDRCRFRNTTQTIAKNDATGFFAKTFQRVSPPMMYQSVYKAFTRNFILRENYPNVEQEDSEQENLMLKLTLYLKDLGMLDQHSDKAIVWVRNKKDESDYRNTDEFLEKIITEIKNKMIEHIILVGHGLNHDQREVLEKFPEIIFYDLTEIENSEILKLIIGNHQIAGQLLLFKTLQDKFQARFAIGMMSGAMDGPAFTGLPTVIITYDSKMGRIPSAAQFISTMICVHYDRSNMKLENEDSIACAIERALILADQLIAEASQDMTPSIQLRY